MWHDPASAEGQADVSPEAKQPFSIGELLSWGEKTLSFLGNGEARASAERLLKHTLGENRSGLHQKIRASASKEQSEKFRRLVFLRGERRPTAYLTGKVSFWDEILEVSEACLIPRPETETLVECFIEKTGYRPDDTFSFLDLGAGSGAIGIAILRSFKSARGILSDVSAEALEVARRNLAFYGLLERCGSVRSDHFDAFRQWPQRPHWDAVVSNPPYLSWQDLKQAQPELEFEPRIALDGGADGLDFYRRLAREAGDYLNPRGWLILEIGIGQSTPVSDFLTQNGFNDIRVYQDYNAIDRVVMARKNS